MSKPCSRNSRVHSATNRCRKGPGISERRIFSSFATDCFTSTWLHPPLLVTFCLSGADARVSRSAPAAGGGRHAPIRSRRGPRGARASHFSEFWPFVDSVAREPNDGPQTLFSRGSEGCPPQAKSGVWARSEVRQGAMRFFWRVRSWSSPSSARGDACRKRTGPSLDEHLMRDPARPGSVRGRGVPAAVVRAAGFTQSRIR
jgi:hypothetical protein